MKKQYLLFVALVSMLMIVSAYPSQDSTPRCDLEMRTIGATYFYTNFSSPYPTYFTFSGFVTNIGNTTCEAEYVYFRYTKASNPSSTKEVKVRANPIPPGVTNIVNAPFQSFTNNSRGTYRLYVMADYGNFIQEYNEANNANKTTIFVNP